MSKDDIKKERTRQAQAKYRTRKKKRQDWLKANIDEANARIARLQQQIKLKRSELCTNRGSDVSTYPSNTLPSFLENKEPDTSPRSCNGKSEVVSEDFGEHSQPVSQFVYPSPVACDEIWGNHHETSSIDPTPSSLPVEVDTGKVIDPRILQSTVVKHDTDGFGVTEEQRLDPTTKSQSFSPISRVIPDLQADLLQLENGFLQGNNWDYQPRDRIEGGLKSIPQCHLGERFQNTAQKFLSLIHILASGQGSLPRVS